MPISHMPPSGIMRRVARLGCSLALERMDGGFLPTSCSVAEMIGLSACVAGALMRRLPVCGLAALLAGEPLQYYLGTEYFRGREYLVRPEVLIPRADTEVLVELVLEKAPQGALVLDLCCGSGIVGIETVLCRKDLSVLGFDLSEAALALSRDNAARLGAERISFERGDVLSPAFPSRARALSPALLAANPPYLTGEEMQALADNVRREPALALDGGEDGLLFYRALLDLSCALGIPLAAEIGWKQRLPLEKLALERGGCICFYPDPSGRDRAFYFLPQSH